MKSLQITVEEALTAPIYFLFLKDCKGCDAYKKKAEEYGIPYLIADDIFGAPMNAIQDDGKVYSPALWKGDQHVVSPSDDVIKILLNQVRDEEE